MLVLICNVVVLQADVVAFFCINFSSKMTILLYCLFQPLLCFCGDNARKIKRRKGKRQGKSKELPPTML